MYENDKVIDLSQVQNQFYDFEIATAGGAMLREINGNKCVNDNTLHQHFMSVYFL